jgi:hypothetical protein
MLFIGHQNLSSKYECEREGMRARALGTEHGTLAALVKRSQIAATANKTDSKRGFCYDHVKGSSFNARGFKTLNIKLSTLNRLQADVCECNVFGNKTV